MNFTQNEITTFQKYVAVTNVPINFEIISKSKIKLTYKYDEEIYLNLTKLFQFEASGKTSNSEYHSFCNKDINQFIYLLTNWIDTIKRDNPFTIIKSDSIEEFSLKFYKIFQEAIIINYIGFKESAGMIYRKSLEILIKDYLINILPDYKEVILNETVGGIVFFFFDVVENNLKPRENRKYKKNLKNFVGISQQLNEILPFITFVDKTFKIGNDFSHYERNLENYTSTDLENNIITIIEYLEIKYKIEKEKLKISEIDQKFNNYKLDK